jgi:hypothetical protein
MRIGLFVLLQGMCCELARGLWGAFLGLQHVLLPNSRFGRAAQTYCVYWIKSLRVKSCGCIYSGIITEVTLKLQPGLLKTKLWGTTPMPDTDIADKLLDMIVSVGLG